MTETYEPGRPHVVVDVAVLTVDDELGFAVLLVKGSQWERENAAEWRLPGMYIKSYETLRDASLRALRQKAEVEGLNPLQLHVFDEPTRDERGWTISVAHFDVVRRDRIVLKEHTALYSVNELPELDFDHKAIIELAVEKMRQVYRDRPDPYSLLAEQDFAIIDLRDLHKSVLDEALNIDTFRRQMMPHLEATDEWRTGLRGKPARLYRRR